ncbi:uncharacterized protein LOC122498667 [Leptopilina heterotoma]|uniref:uncharacterized protein LOC122498667 n=1 Tax=Leptopilina heterotoma TaxID=63436 RepID=UPI001CA863DB|nr:uncharacterized protein LOC122498667 [Leptopilina heterotoma]
MSMYNQGLWENVNINSREDNNVNGVIFNMEWTREKTLELLKEYQARRVLWDCNTRGYRDRIKRRKAIQELADILGCNTLEVEKKVTNLKCQYSREVHKIQNSKENSNSPDDLYVSKWFAFKSMQFLRFGTRRYRRKKAIDDSKSMEEEYLVSNIDPESLTFIDENDETNGSATGSFNASLSEDAEELTISSSVKENEHYSQTENYHNINNETDHVVKNEIKNDEKKKSVKEEYMKFGESIALQLAEISDSYSRSVAKLKINQILFEAEIGIYAQARR